MSICDGIYHPAYRPGFRVMKNGEQCWTVLSPDNSIVSYHDSEADAFEAAERADD